MPSSKDLKQFWEESNSQKSDPKLSEFELVKIVKSKMKKEKKNIAEYFWSSFIYHIFIYSLMCHLIIKHWNDTRLIILCSIMIFLFLPYTFMLFKKIKTILLPQAGSINSTDLNVQSHIKGQYALLSSFYKFKKWFDLIVVPLSSLILIAIVFELYVNGGIRENIYSMLFVFLFALLLFIIATYSENKKRFIIPLSRLKVILDDIKNNG